MKVLSLVFCCLSFSLFGAPTDVLVNKEFVEKLIPAQAPINYFAPSSFGEGEKAWEELKDPQGIAIDLGPWAGRDLPLLSNHFYHVIAVHVDPNSLDRVKRDLEERNLLNVSFCNQPILDVGKNVLVDSANLFSPLERMRGKNIERKSLTLKQLIHDYIYTNEDMDVHPISLIKCNMEGREEDLLEDLLYFAYYNKSKVHLAFHLDWWKCRNIRDFEYLFKFFKVDPSISDVCQYLESHPFASLLFEPLSDAGVLIKRQIPVVIIGYNQLTFIKNMVNQLKKYTKDIIIVDNNSSYEPLLNYYNEEFNYTLLRKKQNFGSEVYRQSFVQKLVGDVYILTDPDLQFNSQLPNNFLQDLLDISNHFQANRVGFALAIDSPDIRTDVSLYGKSIKEWEGQFWIKKVIYPKNPKIEIYLADIDTTFCLINKTFQNRHLRVAGDYTCFHIPWHKDFQKNLQEGEYESVLKGNISTNWFGHH